MARAPRERPIAIVLSCEHAGNRVPPEFRELFRAHADLLASHRGWDPGALPIARALAAAFHTPLAFTTVTRLLVEPNRSPRHPALFSAISRDLDAPIRQRILARHYTPHRTAMRDRVAQLIADGRRVLHIGVHTFTPVLAGVTRNADVGLLYDPRRRTERTFCAEWARAIRDIDPALSVRLNYPYRGAADGLTTWLRREFRAAQYMGIELEINQALAASSSPATRRRATRAIIDSLNLILETTA